MVVLVLGLIAGAAAAWTIVHQARRTAAEEVAAAVAIAKSNPAAVASLESLPAVQSVRVHDAAGKLIAEFQRPAARYGLAERLAPAEVVCDSGTDGSVCVESSPGAIVGAVRTASLLAAIVPLVAGLAGFIAGRALAASADARLRRMSDVIDKASRERDWSQRLEPAAGELGRLITSINELLAQIQEREIAVRRRTLEVEAVNKDLESFAYSVSHDLRSPLGSIDGFTQALELDYGDKFDDTAREYLGWIHEAIRQMRDLIDGLLQMSRLAKYEVQRETVDLSSIAQSVADSLKQNQPDRAVKFEIRDGVSAVGDERLLRAVLENLIGNAWKFTRNKTDARIEFGAAGDAFYIRDNGAGFDPAHAAKMFRPFQRLHSAREFEGTGIGLATVQKIVERHGGRAWAEGEVEKGATIYFTTG